MGRIAGLLVALAAVGALAWFFLRSSSEPAPTAPVEPGRAAATQRVREDASTPQVASPEPNTEESVAQAGAVDQRAVAEGARGAAGSWVASGRVLTGVRAARPGARLIARLLTDGGEGAQVLREDRLTADDEGRFRWPLDVPDGPFHIEVSGDEEGTRSSADRRDLSPESPAPDDLEVRIYPLDVTLEGVVRGPDGPIAGARVKSGWRDHEAATDAEGRYSLVVSSARSNTYLYGIAPGYAVERVTASTDKATGRTLRADFELVREMRVAGLVVGKHGSPVPGVVVRTFSNSDESFTTGVDGRFELGYMDPRRRSHTVYARKDGYVEAARQLEPGEEGLDALELVMRVGAQVEGVVLGPDGAPLAGAELYIGFSPSAYNRLEAHSDEAGRFVFPNVGGGEQTLVTQARGFAADRRVFTVPTEQRFLAPLEVRLERGRTVAGIVRTPGGEVLEGIYVAPLHRREYLDVQVVTDAEGLFRFPSLPEQGLELEFYSRRTVRHNLPVPSGAADALEVELQPVGVVAGRVVDAASGEPVRDFTVRFVRPVLEPGEQPVSGYSAVWAREGKRFSSESGEWSSEGEELEAGTWLAIEVSAEGYGPALAPRVVVAAEPDPDALEMALDRPSAIQGLLLTESDEAVPGATIVALPEAAAPPGYSERLERGSARTDDAGRFRIEDLAPGRVLLYITPQSGAPFRDGPHELFAGGELERIVRQEGGGVLSGQVLAHDGSPYNGARVRLGFSSSSNEQWPRYFQNEQDTDAQGAFRFEGLPDGTYQVSQVAEAGDRQIYLLSVQVEVRGGAGTALLHASGSASIRGRVEFEGKALASDVNVSALWRGPLGGDEPGAERPPSRGTLTSAGRFQLQHLVPGRYSLTAHQWTSSGMMSGGVDVNVGEDEEVETVLELVIR